MNWTKFFIAFIAAFIFIFLWGWLVNQMFMKNVYAATAELWRPPNEVMSRLHWLILGQAILAFALVLIFASGFSRGGVAAGIKLGIMIEILALGARLMMYAVQPFPARLVVYWTIAGFIEMMAAGAIIGALYKPGPVDTR